ncbi:MAG: YceI family protein [Lysobacterales bacterium]
MKHLFWAVALFCITPAHCADWKIDGAASSLSFVSTKNVDVSESHRFTSVDGTLAEDGSFVLTIDLKSLDTLIPIRNDRIHEHLFGGAESASVTGKVDLAMLADIGVGQSELVDLPADLNLLGTTTPLLAKVQISAETDRLTVVSTQPLLLNMRVLGLGNGIEKLREIAGLTSISMAVPTYFNITLRREP